MPGRFPSAMTTSTPDQVAIFAAASFEAIPPLPAAVPGPPASTFQAVVDLDDLFDERGLRRHARVRGEQARRVGEQQQGLGAHQVGHERAEPVVVAEADLLVGDRVVLVHDRHDPEVEEVGQGPPGVEVLLAVDEVEGGEQDLAGQEPVAGEAVLPGAHEAVLAHGRDGLQHGGLARAIPGAPEAAQPAVMAPEVTTTTGRPSSCSCARPSQIRPIAASSTVPDGVVTVEEPTFTTSGALTVATCVGSAVRARRRPRGPRAPRPARGTT